MGAPDDQLVSPDIMFLVVVLLGLAQGGIVRDYVNNIINNALSNIHSINRINEIVNNAVNNINMVESVEGINNISSEIVNNAVNNIKIVESVGGINNITNEIVSNAVNNIKIVESINNLTSNAVNNINGSVLNTINTNAVNSISGDGLLINVNRIVVVDNNSSSHGIEGSNHIGDIEYVEATTDKIVPDDIEDTTTEQNKEADDMEDAAYQMMLPNYIEDTTEQNKLPDYAEDSMELIMVPDYTEDTTDQNDGIDYEEDPTHEVTEVMNNLNMEDTVNFEDMVMTENIEGVEENIEDMEANAMECITGWTYFPHTGLCYRHYTAWKLYWEQARTFCRSSGPGGDLASVPDLATNRFLAALAPSYAWIGATDGGPEGGWRWSDGSPWTFTNWSPTFPTPGPGRSGRQHYGAINWLSPGVWNQGDTARWQQNFICQYVAVELIF